MSIWLNMLIKKNSEIKIKSTKYEKYGRRIKKTRGKN